MAKQTWVYLMKDLRNGFYKIGESAVPQYREKTLQSEQPLIELVEAWSGTTDDEKHLHRCFAEKRIRGEWFRLNDSDIEEIEKYFFSAINFSEGKSRRDDFEAFFNEYLRIEDKKEFIVSRFIYA